MITPALRLLTCLLLLSGTAGAAPQRIGWDDLKGSVTAGATVGEAGLSLNGSLVGSDIDLAGYLLPVDREGDHVHSFLLVPVSGACSHMPAPAPNQTVLVTLTQPYNPIQIYEPIRIKGQLRELHTNSQLFIFDGVKVVESAYAMDGAELSPAPELPTAQGIGSPFFNRRFMSEPGHTPP